MSKFHFFYNTSGSIDRALSRHRLGDEELCEAVENCAAEALAIYPDEHKNRENDEADGRRFLEVELVDVFRLLRGAGDLFVRKS